MKLKESLESITANLPDRLKFSFDTEKIVSASLENLPVWNLGSLITSMNSIDTTAGFDRMLALGLDGGYRNEFDRKMEEYREGMSVMGNLRMAESLYSIMRGFDAQLVQANRNVYEEVGSMALNWPGPFDRNPAAREWAIRVIERYSLVKGTEYRTIRFADYKDYVNGTVKLKALKGMDGRIDFSDPATYKGLDSDELEVYVELETTHLNKEIDRIFGKTGLFNAHVDAEMYRLSGTEEHEGEFTSAYIAYMEGEAKRGGGWFNAPVAPGLPSSRVISQVGGSIVLSASGAPWAAAIYNAAFTAIDVQEGKLSWRQAALQSGIGFATGMLGPGLGTLGTIGTSGIDYRENGDIDWSNSKFKSGVKSGTARFVVQGITGNAVLTNIAMSGLETEGGFKEWGWDNENWKEHVAQGIVTGIASDLSSVLANGNPYAQNAMNAMISGGLMSLYDRAGGNRPENRFDWNQTITSLDQTANWMGQQFANYMNNKRTDNGGSSEENPLPRGPLDDILGGLAYGLHKGNEYMQEIQDSIGGLISEPVSEGTRKATGESVSSRSAGDGYTAAIQGTANLLTRVMETTGLASLGRMITGGVKWLSDGIEAKMSDLIYGETEGAGGIVTNFSGIDRDVLERIQKMPVQSTHGLNDVLESPAPPPPPVSPIAENKEQGVVSSFFEKFSNLIRHGEFALDDSEEVFNAKVQDYHKKMASLYKDKIDSGKFTESDKVFYYQNRMFAGDELNDSELDDYNKAFKDAFQKRDLDAEKEILKTSRRDSRINTEIKLLEMGYQGYDTLELREKLGEMQKKKGYNKPLNEWELKVLENYEPGSLNATLPESYWKKQIAKYSKSKDPWCSSYVGLELSKEGIYFPPVKSNDQRTYMETSYQWEGLGLDHQKAWELAKDGYKVVASYQDYSVKYGHIAMVNGSQDMERGLPFISGYLGGKSQTQIFDRVFGRKKVSQTQYFYYKGK